MIFFRINTVIIAPPTVVIAENLGRAKLCLKKLNGAKWSTERVNSEYLARLGPKNGGSIRQEYLKFRMYQFQNIWVAENMVFHNIEKGGHWKTWSR